MTVTIYNRVEYSMIQGCYKLIWFNIELNTLLLKWTVEGAINNRILDNACKVVAKSIDDGWWWKKKRGGKGRRSLLRRGEKKRRTLVFYLCETRATEIFDLRQSRYTDRRLDWRSCYVRDLWAAINLLYLFSRYIWSIDKRWNFYFCAWNNIFFNPMSIQPSCTK